MFYAGNQLNELINWSSALFFALINLIAPLMLYLYQLRTQGEEDDDGSESLLGPAINSPSQRNDARSFSL